MRFALCASCFAVTFGLVGPAFARDPAKEKPPVTHEKKDEQGRILSRVVFRPDGTVQHFAVMYGPRASKVTAIVDLDPFRDPVTAKRETFDEDGRIVEREESLVREGRKVKTRTTFAYDAQGRQTSTTKVE